jgi:hypothetical protein
MRVIPILPSSEGTYVRRVLPPDAIQSIDDPAFEPTSHGDPEDRGAVYDRVVDGR